MFETGFLAGLIAKITGLGTAVKALLAGTTAAAAMTVTATVAGVGPFQPSSTDTPPVTLAAGATGTAGAGVATAGASSTGSVTGTVEASPSGASVNASVQGSTTPPSVPSVPAPTVPPVPTTLPAVPQLPLPALDAGIPPCVTALVQTATSGTPDPTTLAAQAKSCAQTLVAGANLPTNVTRCVESAFNLMGSIKDGNFSSIDNLVEACIPAGIPVPTGDWFPDLGSFPGMGTGTFPFPDMGSFMPGMGSMPGFNFSGSTSGQVGAGS